MSKLIEVLQSLVGLANGDFIAIGSLADDASGGHVKKFFETTQGKHDSAIAEDTRDALLEMLKQVAYDATAFRGVLKVLELLNSDLDAVMKITAKWEARLDEAEPEPDLRDFLVGATSITPAFLSSRGPQRRMFIEALRGSYTPELFIFGFGQETLEALIEADLVPGDIAVLDSLARMKGAVLDLTAFLTGSASEADGERLEAYERLAKGGFVDILTQDQTGQLFITHRTQATSWHIKIRATVKGRRLLTMMKAGRGE